MSTFSVADNIVKMERCGRKSRRDLSTAQQCICLCSKSQQHGVQKSPGSSVAHVRLLRQIAASDCSEMMASHLHFDDDVCHNLEVPTNIASTATFGCICELRGTPLRGVETWRHHVIFFACVDILRRLFRKDIKTIQPCRQKPITFFSQCHN